MKKYPCLFVLGTLFCITAQAASPAKIKVLSALYGPAEVTGSVSNECDGRESCDYIVSVGQIGDPAPGVVKSFTVQYRCKGASIYTAFVKAEADGSHAYLNCGKTQPESAVAIRVLKASYGPLDATDSIGSECNGHGSCSYLVTTDRLGDPLYGYYKAFSVDYTCNGHLHHEYVSAEASGRHANLYCQ